MYSLATSIYRRTADRLERFAFEKRRDARRRHRPYDLKRHAFQIILAIWALFTASCVNLPDGMLTKKFYLPMHVAFKKELSIAEIKKQLPLQLEETRYLKDISFDPKNNRVTQTIAITNGTREEAYANFSESLMKKAFSGYLCDVNKKNFRNGYDNLEFIFLDKNDREIVRIFLSPEICRQEKALP